MKYKLDEDSELSESERAELMLREQRWKSTYKNL